MEFYLSALVLGLCLACMALGIFISMKIFNIPDITTDGSFTLGAVITAMLITHHQNVWIAIPAVLCSGALAGMITAWIHTKLRIDALLAGILNMTALYSINLVLLGRSNVPFIGVKTIFKWLSPVSSATSDMIPAFVIVAILIALLSYLFRTDFGIAVRATGNSPSMAKSLGINNDKMKVIGLGIANALTALSGYLVAQYQGFTDINMGIGIVITGLGTVLIGDTLIKWLKITSISKQLLMIPIGSIVFQMVLAVTLSMGVDPNLLKLVTALFVLAIVYIPNLKLKQK